MRLRRRISVTIEKREVTISYQGTAREQAHCRCCDREVSMLPVGLAAGITGVPERLLYQRVEAGKLHFLERSNGVVLICAESLRGMQRDGTERQPARRDVRLES